MQDKSEKGTHLVKPGGKVCCRINPWEQGLWGSTDSSGVTQQGPTQLLSLLLPICQAGEAAPTSTTDGQ